MSKFSPFDEIRKDSFFSFEESLSLDGSVSDELSDQLSANKRLIYFLLDLIGQEYPINFNEHQSILECVKLNDIAFRFVQLQLVNINSDFGVIVLVDKNTFKPSILYSKRGSTYLSTNANADLSSIVTTKVSGQDLNNLFDNSIEFGMQVFAQLPWHPSSLRALFNFLIYQDQDSLYSLLIATSLISFVQLLIPIFTASIFGSIVPSSDYSHFISLLLVLIPLSLLLFASNYFRARIFARLESVLDYRLQSAVLFRVLRQPLDFLQSFSVADFVMRITGFTSIRRSITNSTITTIFGIVFGLLSLGLMYLYQSKITLYILALYTFFSLVFYCLGRRQFKYANKALILLAKTFDKTTLLIESISQLRSTATETLFLREWAVYVRKLADNNFNKNVISDNQQLLATLTYQISMSFLLFLVSYDIYLSKVVPTHISLTGLFPYDPIMAGSFLAFVVAFTNFDSYYTSLIVVIADSVINAGAQWSISNELLSQEPELGYRLDSIKIKPTGLIDFRGVYFSLDGKSILRNVNLSIFPGQSIGITGPSGSGKSSFIRLITALHLADEGSILIDNLPITKIDLRSLRSSVGVVTQTSQIPSTSIKEFLAPSFSYSDNEIWNSLKLACIDEEVSEMPMKLETILSEGASNISGGQRQRILLAKALISNPSILLLDEATSALSESSQQKIISNLSSSNITTISIAHRLSTLKLCDCIYVLENGSFSQSGTYSELSADISGYFAKSLSQGSY